MDLFDSSAPSQPQQQQQRPPPSSNDLFSGMSSPPPTAPSAPSIPTFPCYDKNDLNITLQLQRNAEGVIQVIARFRNNSMHQSLSSVNLQAAVPKTQKLQLNAMSSPELGPGSEATQSLRITGSKGVSCPSSSVLTYANLCLAAVATTSQDLVCTSWSRSGHRSGRLVGTQMMTFVMYGRG